MNEKTFEKIRRKMLDLISFKISQEKEEIATNDNEIEENEILLIELKDGYKNFLIYRDEIFNIIEYYFEVRKDIPENEKESFKKNLITLFAIINLNENMITQPNYSQEDVEFINMVYNIIEETINLRKNMPQEQKLKDEINRLTKLYGQISSPETETDFIEPSSVMKLDVDVDIFELATFVQKINRTIINNSILINNEEETIDLISNRAPTLISYDVLKQAFYTRGLNDIFDNLEQNTKYINYLRKGNIRKICSSLDCLTNGNYKNDLGFLLQYGRSSDDKLAKLFCQVIKNLDVSLISYLKNYAITYNVSLKDLFDNVPGIYKHNALSGSKPEPGDGNMDIDISGGYDNFSANVKAIEAYVKKVINKVSVDEEGNIRETADGDVILENKKHSEVLINSLIMNCGSCLITTPDVFKRNLELTVMYGLDSPYYSFEKYGTSLTSRNFENYMDRILEANKSKDSEYGLLDYINKFRALAQRPESEFDSILYNYETNNLSFTNRGEIRDKRSKINTPYSRINAFFSGKKDIEAFEKNLDQNLVEFLKNYHLTPQVLLEYSNNPIIRNLDDNYMDIENPNRYIIGGVYVSRNKVIRIISGIEKFYNWASKEKLSDDIILEYALIYGGAFTKEQYDNLVEAAKKL